MKFAIRNYRRLSELEVELDDLMLIIGPNGSGKTSLVEAMYLASSGGSATAPLRTNPLRAVLIAKGMPYVPDIGDGLVEANDVRISQSVCDSEVDAELNKLREGFALHALFGFLARLSGAPIAEAAYRELGRLYACGPEGNSAVAVFANFLLDASRGEPASAVFISPRLAAELDYVSALIDHVSSQSPEWHAAVMHKFGELKIRNVRNINGVPHVVAQRALPLSLAPAGYAYAIALSLALGAGEYVFIDEPEAHMHPALLDLVKDVVEMALDRGVKVAVATQSVEALDKLSTIGRGAVVRMKDCKIHDVIPMEEARRRIDELYEDLRFY